MEATNSTVLEVTIPENGAIVPVVTSSMEEAMHLQGLLWVHKSVESNIVYAGIDASELEITPYQRIAVAMIMQELHTELATLEQHARTSSIDFAEYGDNVIDFAAVRAAKQTRNLVLSFEDY